jgi:hypothetical protein
LAISHWGKGNPSTITRWDPAATYAVTFADGSNPPVTRTGAELMNTGIHVALKGHFVSEWIFLN